MSLKDDRLQNQVTRALRELREGGRLMAMVIKDRFSLLSDLLTEEEKRRIDKLVDEALKKLVPTEKLRNPREYPSKR